MATKTRAKAKRKKTTVTKPARRRKTVRKTRMIRKKAAKKAPQGCQTTAAGNLLGSTILPSHRESHLTQP